jgi:hypothetical protein
MQHVSENDNKINEGRQIPNLEAAGSNPAGVTTSSFFPNLNSRLTLFCGTASTAAGIKADVVELAN